MFPSRVLTCSVTCDDVLRLPLLPTPEIWSVVFFPLNLSFFIKCSDTSVVSGPSSNKKFPFSSKPPVPTLETTTTPKVMPYCSCFVVVARTFCSRCNRGWCFPLQFEVQLFLAWTISRDVGFLQASEAESFLFDEVEMVFGCQILYSSLFYDCSNSSCIWESFVGYEEIFSDDVHLSSIFFLEWSVVVELHNRIFPSLLSMY